jgi:hypothetical protein
LLAALCRILHGLRNDSWLRDRLNILLERIGLYGTTRQDHNDE